MSGEYSISASYTKRFLITIPSSATTAVTFQTVLRTAMTAAGLTQAAQENIVSRICKIKVLGLNSDASDRLAFRVWNAEQVTAIQQVALAADYYEAATGDINSFVSAKAAADMTAVMVCFLV